MPYMLLHTSEDGVPFTILSDEDLQTLLADPEGEYGISNFHGPGWLATNNDPNYWGRKDGVLIEYNIKSVVPAGGYRIDQ
jgi:hypothetical protein